MIDIKTVPYEDRENTNEICFLNPLNDLKTSILNQCSSNFLNFKELKELMKFLESFNENKLKTQKSALIIKQRRFECFSI